MNKSAFLFSFFIFLSFASNAQEWFLDLELAKAKASEENKAILLVFQGSDWCGPCIKLDRNIWSSEVFVNNYPVTFVLLRADFPRRKKNALPKKQEEKNNLLAAAYNPNGLFPLVVVLDAKGLVLGRTGYSKDSPLAYLKKLQKFTDQLEEN
ncbi:thioredoxin family protein [Flavicella sp.]|jgi:thioredoxin-related protein|nr:thioredoxin family protein [Flavicella sp.]MDA9111545.1 thioredoxin family protein [Flavicella sp.]